MQKALVATLLVLAVVAVGCGRGGDEPPVAEATPAAATGGSGAAGGTSEDLADEGFEAGEAESLKPAAGDAGEDGS